jgi:hypothetical protein
VEARGTRDQVTDVQDDRNATDDIPGRPKRMFRDRREMCNKTAGRTLNTEKLIATIVSARGSSVGAVAMPIKDPRFQRNANAAAMLGSKLRSTAARRQSTRKRYKRIPNAITPAQCPNHIDQNRCVQAKPVRHSSLTIPEPESAGFRKRPTVSENHSQSVCGSEREHPSA